MEFTNTFHVPVDIDTAFATLIDLEKVAPSLPGAVLEEVDGDTCTGRCKVEGGTDVTVVTDLNITGKPAQFGRGVMADVGNKIIDTFAERLQALVTEGETEPAEPGPEATVTGAAAADEKVSEALAEPVADAVPSGPRKVAFDPAQEEDALDIMATGGGAVAKRALPVAGVAALIVGLVWWLRRR